MSRRPTETVSIGGTCDWQHVGHDAFRPSWTPGAGTHATSRVAVVWAGQRRSRRSCARETGRARKAVCRACRRPLEWRSAGRRGHTARTLSASIASTARARIRKRRKPCVARNRRDVISTLIPRCTTQAVRCQGAAVRSRRASQASDSSNGIRSSGARIRISRV